MSPSKGKLLVASVVERALHVGSIVLNRSIGIKMDILGAARSVVEVFAIGLLG